MVDGVIEEQDFGRFDKNRGQRQQVVLHHDVDAARQRFRQQLHHWPNRQEGEHRQQHAENPGREVVYQHLEAAFDLPINPAVKAFDGPAAQRTGDHRTHKHRHIGADNHAHGGDRADHAAALAAHEATPGIAD